MDPNIALPLIPVVLAGGVGSRLWPLSRESAPKPLMLLPDGETLLGKTGQRAAALRGLRELITVTNRDHYFHTKDIYASLGAHGPRVCTYLLEPFGRNTAPAIALAALLVEARHGPQAILLVMPADHLIRDGAAFNAAAARAAELANEGRLVTFGIAPTHPETGFGYIECGQAIGPSAYVAARFVEKPPMVEARAMVDAGNYLWNSGMFAFSAASVLSAFERHAPLVLSAMRTVWQGLRAKSGEPVLEIDPASFAAAPEISFDFAVMESAAALAEVAVVRATFDWSDVGSWQAMSALSASDDDGNSGSGERVTIATRDTYVYAADRVVATVGVNDLVIVDTPDALLVAHRDHLQRVREVVGELKTRGHEAYRLHKTVARPWGTYTVLEEGAEFKIKRIEVKPGASLSLQLHHRRSEHWVVVKGTARVTCGEATFDIGSGQSTYIPIETKHRLENRGEEMLAIIEVQCGDYLGEDDIVRFDDKYGRVPA